MAVVYFMRRGDRLLMCDRRFFPDGDTEKFIGHPLFLLEAKGLLRKGDSIKKMMGDMRENQSYKMVLKKWPIE
jgi:hypothetical protein